MKKNLLKVAVLSIALLFVNSLYAGHKNGGFNLHGLKSISVEVSAKGLLNEQTLTRLRTDIQLKLRSAGLELKNKPDSKTVIIVITAHGVSGITSTPVSMELSLFEKVMVNRGKNRNALAITYQNIKMKKMINTNKDIYQVVMNQLLPKFIEKYLEQNT